MKAETFHGLTNVAQALVKGVCPVCTILKDYQWVLATRPQAPPDARVCNFHCWSLARSRGSGLSRSTPGEVVTGIFLEMLRGPLAGKVSAEECVFCRQILEQEEVKLRELATQLQNTTLGHWIKTQGTLCVPHASKLKEFVPLKHRNAIDEIVERNRRELVEELERFGEQLKHGIHEGGGLLGRVAEFLVGQRGL